MKLFGINLGPKRPVEPRITPNDRDWVEENFEWMVTALGYPRTEQVTLSEKYFPHTLQSAEINIENLLADCCAWLQLDPRLFSYEIIEDIRDTQGLPYGIEDPPVDCLLEIDENGKYKLWLAKNIFLHPNWLIASVCIELSKAKLLESKVAIEDGPETQLFIYLVAVFYGYGFMLASNLSDIGVERDITWETKWVMVSGLPYPVLAYALAMYARLTQNDEPTWREMLSAEMKEEFDLCVAYIDGCGNKFFDKERINKAIAVDKLWDEADKHYNAAEYREGIAILEQLITMIDSDEEKANVHNEIGYYLLRDRKYADSIIHFERSIEKYPGYGYGPDNLGFAYLMLNEPEKGKHYLDQAFLTKNNHPAYSFRNMALYHQKKGEMELAESFFQKAFELKTEVDLLDLFYGLFLLEQGNKQKAMTHIKISADSREPEGIEKWMELNE